MELLGYNMENEVLNEYKIDLSERRDNGPYKINCLCMFVLIIITIIIVLRAEIAWRKINGARFE